MPSARAVDPGRRRAPRRYRRRRGTRVGRCGAALAPCDGRGRAAGAPGSRARGDHGPASDWDLGFLAAPGGEVDPAGLVDAVASVVGTDDVDLVRLDRASARLRFRAARDGIVLVERRADAFLDFRLEAVRFWCDAGSVIRTAQAEVLASLP